MYLILYFVNFSSTRPYYQQQQQYPPNYQRRYLQNVPAGNGINAQVNEPESGVPVQIPAIPIQVPLQASFGSSPNIQNVQLVPCLCPVVEDYDYNKQQETIYIGPNKKN